MPEGTVCKYMVCQIAGIKPRNDATTNYATRNRRDHKSDEIKTDRIEQPASWNDSATSHRSAGDDARIGEMKITAVEKLNHDK